MPTDNPAISADSEKLIMALLHKNPEKRPQTAKELGQRRTSRNSSVGSRCKAPMASPALLLVEKALAKLLDPTRLAQ